MQFRLLGLLAAISLLLHSVAANNTPKYTFYWCANKVMDCCSQSYTDDNKKLGNGRTEGCGRTQWRSQGIKQNRFYMNDRRAWRVKNGHIAGYNEVRTCCSRINVACSYTETIGGVRLLPEFLIGEPGNSIATGKCQGDMAKSIIALESTRGTGYRQWTLKQRRHFKNCGTSKRKKANKSICS